MTTRLIIATDGSALTNPGPAGWCWYADENNWATDGAPRGTNNYAELHAVLDALNATPATLPLELRLDSQYSLDALTKWHRGWARNGWRTAKGTPVANADLIRDILTALRGRDVTFIKVKAHLTRGGDPRNEIADIRARVAARAYRDRTTHDRGPGYTG